MANCQIKLNATAFEVLILAGMRDLLILFVHLIVIMARLAKPGGLRFPHVP
jgi:hypothetical protein